MWVQLSKFVLQNVPSEISTLMILLDPSYYGSFETSLVCLSKFEILVSFSSLYHQFQLLLHILIHDYGFQHRQCFWSKKVFVLKQLSFEVSVHFFSFELHQFRLLLHILIHKYNIQHGLTVFLIKKNPFNHIMDQFSSKLGLNSLFCLYQKLHACNLSDVALSDCHCFYLNGFTFSLPLLSCLFSSDSYIAHMRCCDKGHVKSLH